MAVDPELTAQALVLVQAQAASREQVDAATKASVAAVVRAFLALLPDGSGWRDPAAVTRLAKQLAAATRAGQRSTSTSSAAYWARAVHLLSGRRPTTSVRLVDPAAVRPVPLEAVFGRLADGYRWLEASRGPSSTPEDRLRFALEAHQRKLERLAATHDAPTLGLVHDGADVTAALGRPGGGPTARELADRLDALVRDMPPPTVAPAPLAREEIDRRVLERAELMVDMTLAMTHRAQIEAAAKADPRSVTGYRRVVHPELARSGRSCGLCVAVSTRVFHRGNLLPLHEHCNCEVLPLIGDVGGDGDVGGAINDADLAAVYDAGGGSTKARDLSRTRWRVVQHPEKGAVLVADGTTVTLGKRPAGGSGKGKGRSVTVPQVDPAVVLRAARTSVSDLERRQAAGEDVAAALRWQRALVDRMAALVA